MQGSELKAIRKALGWGQRKFAAELGMTQTYIGMMERGERPIERRTELAARYLEITEGGTWTPIPLPPPSRVVELPTSAVTKRPVKVKGKME